MSTALLNAGIAHMRVKTQIKWKKPYNDFFIMKGERNGCDANGMGLADKG